MNRQWTDQWGRVNKFGTSAPLLASPQGGVAERSMECREASIDSEAGVVFRSERKGKPPRLRQLRWLREILLMTQPPLLAVVQGGECAGSEISALRVGTYCRFIRYSPRVIQN